MDSKLRGSRVAPAAETAIMPRLTVARQGPVGSTTVFGRTTQRRILRRPISDQPTVAEHVWPEDDHEDEQTPTVFFPIEDDFSVIGNWYLADSTKVQASDPRAEVHRLWGLALWDMARSDATVFSCVAMLTLHKRRSIASRFDKVTYLDHKQRVYENLCRAVASSGGTVAGTTALSIALLAFAEMREGNSEEARRHINAVAVLDCVCQLDETQWRLVVWNDLRHALKTANLPTLRYYMPPSLTAALANINSAVLAEARRLALSNWKHLKRYPDLEKSVWFQLSISLHTISILADSRTSTIQHAHLATAYEAEYQAQTVAANLMTQIAPKKTQPINNILILACQFHILATTSGFAPSTVECREALLLRVRSALDKLGVGSDPEQARTHEPALLWALSTFATHSMDGGFQHRQYFIQLLAAIIDMKRLPSRCAFERMLRAWPWTDTWHSTRVPSLWEEILIARGRRWRCIATGDSQEQCIGKKSERYYAGILLFYGS